MCTIKVAQICREKESLHKHAARMEFCTNIQPESKFAQIHVSSLNKKYAARMDICIYTNVNKTTLLYLSVKQPILMQSEYDLTIIGSQKSKLFLKKTKFLLPIG